MTKRTNPADLVDAAKAEASQVELAKAKQEARKWRAKHKDALQQALESNRQLDVMLQMKGWSHQPRSIPRLNKRTGKRTVAAVVPATDWHVEETIEPEAVNYKNEYNLDIAEDRIKTFYGKVDEMIEHQNRWAKVSEIWHPLLGDLLSGYIHEELMETNSLSPTEACVFLQDQIVSGVDFLRKRTKLPIYLPCCVGNHGRTTPKKRIKTSCRNSYEWLLYKTLESYYRKDSRVHFNVASGYHNTQVIMGRKTRFHHGDGLRYQGGVGGISIPVNKSVAQWDKVDPADFDIFGHWHTFLAHYPKWVSCGSLMGYSEYSVEIKAEFQHPTQTFMVIDSLYGMTHALPIFVTKPARSDDV
jgi:hypothetical protein